MTELLIIVGIIVYALIGIICAWLIFNPKTIGGIIGTIVWGMVFGSLIVIFFAFEKILTIKVRK